MVQNKKIEKPEIRFDKLEKLANHLKTGKLGHKQFNFAVYNDVEENVCGTAGCAIGECPIAFPNEWSFNENGDPILKPAQTKPYISGRIFFGLNVAQYDHLFNPDMQKPELFGGIKLTDKATKDQVAENILAFIKHLKIIE